MFKADHHFESNDRRFIVTIREGALSEIIDTAMRAGANETGGILIGEIDAEGRAIIVEATSKPKGSKFTWRTFVRAPSGLARLLKSRWEQKQHYLGEWHSHPRSSPHPSGQDCSSMKAIALDENYDSREPILVVVGTKVGGAELSVTVFPKGEPHVTLVAAEHAKAFA